MSRILKVGNSDYRVKVQSTGTITLDTGDRVGTVVVTGNLDVQGTLTTIESTNTTIKDNIILINQGENGSGITLGTAGIQIDRGNYQDAQFLFDESISHWDPTTSTYVDGTFVLKTADDKLSGLAVGVIANDGTTDIVFDMQGGASILSIANSTNYEARVLNPNDIPNKQYVNDYVYASGGSAIVDRLFFPVTATNGYEDSKIQAYSTNIEFLIASNVKAQISAAGLAVNDVLISGNTITATQSSNLKITSNSQTVDVDASLALYDRASSPGTTTGRTKLYSQAVAGPGKTGLYITNVNTSDELISKSRAVLFSILL